ncbi:hypothetical protein NEF87_000800 [Candidatus Lokiarchaeum ossiferum]|uniref:4Fe-4S ferredoxin-type domain-containing protein n=1 Tax=Candidatus Lokiarchaeum ossiferum TaxID=2951803 RepID=A0ABY6HLX5_9ARCH|nr:hypothetical protein NEF87_000800 [Candidatus Lokiarchaeum sp. B-35]
MQIEFKNNKSDTQNKVVLSSILYIFSGTGNSLNVALKIKEKMPEFKIISIVDAYEAKEFEIKASKIGFVFPVYFLDIPNIVKKFFKKMNIIGNPYIFTIATAGGKIGRTFKTISKILTKIDRKMDAEYGVITPGNSIVMIDETDTNEEKELKLTTSRQRIEEIIKSIRINEKISFPTKKRTFGELMLSVSGKIFLYRVFSDRLFRVDKELCKQCGTCESVCPMHNIKLINGNPTWNRNCECCAACLHWCPHQAINNLNTKGVSRYHHPEISLKKMKSFSEGVKHE